MSEEEGHSVSWLRLRKVIAEKQMIIKGVKIGLWRCDAVFPRRFERADVTCFEKSKWNAEEVRPPRSSTEGKGSAPAGTYPFNLAELGLLLLLGLLQVAPVWVLVVLLPLGVLLLLQHGTEVHTAGVCRGGQWLSQMGRYIDQGFLISEILKVGFLISEMFFFLNEVANSMHLLSSGLCYSRLER